MSDVSSLISEAKYLFKAQKYQKAEELFKQVVAQKKDFADVYNCLGLIAHEEGRYGEAMKHFKKALKINPRYTEAMLNLSILYNDLGDFQNAKKLVSKSRRDARSTKAAMDPFIRSKLANKHAEVADWYHGVGAYAEAIEEYQKALGLEAKYVDLHTKMAVCLREKGDLKKALDELKKAIRKNTNFPDAHVQLGVTYYALGKKAEARKTWKAAAKKFPKNTAVKMYLRCTESV
ncbi:MAG: tetratricopeptide repeat protein [Deltaproteobacteria bacterium]|nr:tetratricopeptide repeat protein [Deltaproteobacteria bacterium]